MQYEETIMKVLIFGNLASGKSYLATKIREVIPNLEYLSVDDFRRKIGDGTMVKEKKAKQAFLNSILPNKFQLIEATGLGDTGKTIAKILQQTGELKLILILKVPLEICLRRLDARIWDTPYPAPPKHAFKLAEITDELINDNLIQMVWTDVENCKIIELGSITDKEIQQTITNITECIHDEADRNY